MHRENHSVLCSGIHCGSQNMPPWIRGDCCTVLKSVVNAIVKVKIAVNCSLTKQYLCQTLFLGTPRTSR